MRNLIKKYSVAVALSALCALVVPSCKNETDYKAVRQQVMEIHDKVMEDGEKAVKNRMILDTLSKLKLKELKNGRPDLDTAEEKARIRLLITKLNRADERMMEWMHTFEPDIAGKSNAEAVKYFQQEMNKIRALDGEYRKALNESDAYLEKFNLKPASPEGKHDHSKH